MAEMNDYSGPLKPDLKFEDFSKEALIKLLHAYSAGYLQAYYCYNEIVRERHGEEEAFLSGCEYWMRMGIAMNTIECKAMNIDPKDVESFLKSLQVDPGMPHNFDPHPDYATALHMEVKDKNYGSFTMDRCVILDRLEEMGDDQRIFNACHGLEGEGFPNPARMVHNPNIMMRAAKLPPRKNKDEIACKFEFWIED